MASLAASAPSAGPHLSGDLAFVGGAVAFVGDSLAFIRGRVSLVGRSVAFGCLGVNPPRAIAFDGFPPVLRGFTLVGQPVPPVS